MARGDSPMPHPFLKWAGGKRRLLNEILPLLPERIEHYVEPFIGGGAVFFALAREGRVGRAVLADRNPELIHAYRMVRDEPDVLAERVNEWPHDEETYYRVRALDPDALDDLGRAARTLWLNRTGFNGLYRLNSKGIFNVPFGRYKNPRLANLKNFLACSRVLKKAELVVDDFEAVLDGAPRGAVTYCDPPYWPVSRSASFTAYDRLPFGPAEQERLARVFRALPDRGISGVLSNSWVPDTRRLYADLDLRTVLARRNINRDVNGRGHVKEMLVCVPRRDWAERPSPSPTLQ